VSRSFPRSARPPALGSVADSFLDGGHVWLHEYPDGTPLWVRLTATGTLEFAVPVRDGGFLPVTERAETDATAQVKRFTAADAPAEFGFAARHVQRVFDRDALRSAAADASSVEFHCVAVHRRRIGYDWDAAPPVVGLDISQPESSLLPHEVQRAFDAVGIDPAPVVEKEAHSRDIDTDGITLPASEWRDGPALGVLYRAKDGRTARQVGPDDGTEPTAEPITDSAAEYAQSVATAERIDDAVGSLTDADRPADVDTVAEWLFDRTVRASFPDLCHGSAAFDLPELRSELAAVVAERRGRV
jgi:hypothetical protein